MNRIRRCHSSFHSSSISLRFCLDIVLSFTLHHPRFHLFFFFLVFVLSNHFPYRKKSFRHVQLALVTACMHVSLEGKTIKTHKDVRAISHSYLHAQTPLNKLWVEEQATKRTSDFSSRPSSRPRPLFCVCERRDLRERKIPKVTLWFHAWLCAT